MSGVRIEAASGSRNERPRIYARCRRPQLDGIRADPWPQTLWPPPGFGDLAQGFVLNTGFVFICPISTRVRPFPTSVVLPEGLPIAGEIPVSHLRSIDILARPIRPVGASVPAETAEQVRAKLSALIAI